MPNQYKYPFLRLLLPFMVGIYLGFHPFIILSNALLIFILSILLLTCLSVFIYVKSYTYRWVFGVCMSIFMMLTGTTMVHLKNENKGSHIFSDSTFNKTIEARIVEPPNRKEITTGCLVEVTGIQGISEFENYKVLVYLQNYPEMPVFTYGDFISFSKKPEKVSAPLNPEQFNYQEYLSLKGISYQLFLKKGDWEHLSGNRSNFIFRTAYSCRDYLLNILKNNGLDGEEYAVASAIILGYDEELPRYLRKGYVASGTMHVLCVSGLHVGIIYLLFNFILGLVLIKRSTETLKILILLGIVWFYAMITGLTPSVLRSTFMISFILIGSLIGRKGNIINSLAASAFLLLMIDPATILNIGFQLSYLAVLGIALFQKPFYNLLYFKNRALNWIWEATSVTLAAQLVTSPIILFYFHQFPVYFIFSNLLLIPLSFIIIVMGMAVLLLSFLPWIPLWIGYATSAFIYIMNFLVIRIENLPLSTINGLYLTQYEVIMLFMVIALLWIFFNYNNYRTVVPILSIMLVFFFSLTIRNFQNQQTSQIVVYGVNKHAAIELISGKNHVLITDSTFIKDEFAVDYNLRAYWAKMGLNDVFLNAGLNESFIKPGLVKKYHDLISFGGKIFSIWTGEPGLVRQSIEKQPLDFVVVSGNKKESLGLLLSQYHFETLVIDLSVPYWQVNKWKSAAEKAGIQVYDIREQGAYIVDI